jgi:hypothetical protein
LEESDVEKPIPLVRLSIVGSFALGLCLVLETLATADTPLPPPAKKEIWSGNHFYCAVMDPASNLTTVYHVRDGKRIKLWSMLGWFRVAYLSGDGEHLVVGHNGGNLLPLNVTDDDIMAYFVRKGEVIHTLTLHDLVKSKAAMKRTASHYHWGEYLGINEDGLFRVQTLDNTRMFFDTRTGKLERSTTVPLAPTPAD